MLLWRKQMPLRGKMSIKFGSIVLVLMMFFIAKISFETAVAQKTPEEENLRSPASIDKSYYDHVSKR